MRVALALPLDDEQRLADSAAYYGHELVARCSGGDELAVRLGQLPVELVVVAATPTHLTAGLIQAADLLGVRMLVIVNDEEQARHAARLGIIDPVPGPADWTLLDPAAAPHPQPEPETPNPDAPTASAEPRPASIIALWGPHGAPGRTSLAIALAAEFAAAGRRTVLADADTHAASLAPALGLLDEAPGFAAACRLAGLGGLDTRQFERLAVSPRGAQAGLRVLTGITRSARWPELGQEKVAGALDALRQHCEVLVVDIAADLEQDEEFAGEPGAPRRNAAGLEVLRSADRIVAIASADPVGIPRFLRGHAELLELVPAERVSVVVNKLRAGVIGMNPGSQVRQTLARFGSIDDPVLVPWDPGAFDAALLGGRPLADAAPRSPARAAVRELAVRLLPEAAAGGGRRRRRALA